MSDANLPQVPQGAAKDAAATRAAARGGEGRAQFAAPAGTHPAAFPDDALLSCASCGM